MAPGSEFGVSARFRRNGYQQLDTEEERRVEELDLSNLPNEKRSLGYWLRHRAATDGDKAYLTIGAQTHTFGSTEALSRSVARGLAARGIAEGDRVMLLTPNCPEFVFTWFAASLLGAITVPINFNLRGALVDALITDARPKMLVLHGSLLPVLATLAPEVLATVEWIAVIGAPDPGGASPGLAPRMIPFADLRRDDGPDPEIAPDFRRVQMVSYTSGTTGPSKGVVASNAAAFCPAINIIKVLGMARGDTIYAPLPLFHGMSSRQGVVPALLLGLHVVIDERFSASRYWRRAAECGATRGILLHSLIPLLKAQPPDPSDRAHKIKAVFNASHDREFEERFGVHITEAFAMTETSHLINTPFPERKWGSTGKAHPDWEIRLIDADGFEVPAGQAGELVARPRKPFLMMEGYLNKPQATLDAFKGLWYHTGDIARMDDEGYYYYLDRKKDRIRRRGENVSSAEIEAGVCAHPEVVECTALPHPAGDGEDDIRVLAILAPGSRLEPQALSEWLAERMPKFMRPRYLEFVPDLPRTGTDKVEKAKLVAAGLGPGVWDAMQPGETRAEGQMAK